MPPSSGGSPSQIKPVAIDLRPVYTPAVRRILPQAQPAVDLFHVVYLAVKTTGDVRRRDVRGKYGAPRPKWLIWAPQVTRAPDHLRVHSRHR